MRAKFGRDPMAGSKKVTLKFIIGYDNPTYEVANTLICILYLVFHVRAYVSMHACMHARLLSSLSPALTTRMMHE